MNPSLFPVDFLRRLFNIHDMEQEYKSVREGAGVMEMAHEGMIKLSGKDARSFLHALATQDFKNLADGAVTHTAFTNAKARMIADAAAYAISDFIVLSVERSCLQNLLAHLDKYLIAEDVKIEDVTEKMSALYILGKNSGALAENALGIAMGKAVVCRAVALQGTELWCARKDMAKVNGIILFAPYAQVKNLQDNLLSKKDEFGAATFGPDTYEIFRIEAGIPRYNVDMTEENIFPETGMEDAVSYTKGCYLGQETVIRVKHQGQVNRKIVQIKIDTTESVRAGTKVYEGSTQSKKEGGVITSCCFSPHHNAVIALGTLRRECLLEWANNFIETQSGILPAHILKK